MQTLIAVRTWEHNALLHLHGMAERSNKLLKSEFFWVIVILLTLLIGMYELIINSSSGLDMNIASEYPNLFT